MRIATDDDSTGKHKLAAMKGRSAALTGAAPPPLAHAVKGLQLITITAPLAATRSCLPPAAAPACRLPPTRLRRAHRPLQPPCWSASVWE